MAVQPSLLFGMQPAETELLNFLKKRRLKKVVKWALSDNELTDEEVTQISAIKEELGIFENYVESVRINHFSKKISRIIARVSRSRRFSDHDKQEIVNIAKKLQITPDFTSNHAMQMYRNLWKIETHGTFTPTSIDVPIRLTRGEQCYHSARGVWTQVKKIRQNHG